MFSLTHPQRLHEATFPNSFFRGGTAAKGGGRPSPADTCQVWPGCFSITDQVSETDVRLPFPRSFGIDLYGSRSEQWEAWTNFLVVVVVSILNYTKREHFQPASLSGWKGPLTKYKGALQARFGLKFCDFKTSSFNSCSCCCVMTRI